MKSTEKSKIDKKNKNESKHTEKKPRKGKKESSVKEIGNRKERTIFNYRPRMNSFTDLEIFTHIAAKYLCFLLHRVQDGGCFW